MLAVVQPQEYVQWVHSVAIMEVLWTELIEAGLVKDLVVDTL